LKIDNLTELKKLIKACRELGVEAIKIDGIELAINHNLGLGQKAIKARKTLPDYSSDFPEAGLSLRPQNATTALPEALKLKSDEVPDIIDTDELSQEQLLFYSAASQEPVN
jgi:hypothetical protein